MNRTRLFLFCLMLLSSVPACPGSGTAKDIVLGMSAAFTGPSRGLGIELYRGSMAYFEHVNRAGGIGGRRIRILALDDGYNPDPAVENSIRLMNDPDVLCLFNYVGTPTVTRVLPFLNTELGQGKLLFFPFTGAQPQREYPYARRVFNLRASYRQEVQELVNELSFIGRRRVGVFYQNDAYGRSGWDSVRRALSLHRLDIVGEATYRRGATFADSMRQQVDILLESRPEVIVSVGSYEASAAFIRDARDAGMDIPIANLSFAGSESLLELLLQAGQENGKDYTRNLINSQVVPNYTDKTLPAARLYMRLMRENPPVIPAPFTDGYKPFEFSFVGFEGFLNAIVMTHILERYLTSPEKTLAEVVEGVRDFDAGIDTTVTFGPDRHQGITRVYFTTVVDGKFVPVEAKDWQQWSP